MELPQDPQQSLLNTGIGRGYVKGVKNIVSMEKGVCLSLLQKLMAREQQSGAS